MGWSDLSICLEGPVIEDLGAHFVQRWNFIYKTKYSAVEGNRYKPLSLGMPSRSTPVYHADGSNMHLGAASQKMAGVHVLAKVPEDIPQPTAAFSGGGTLHPHRAPSSYFHEIQSRFRRGMENIGKQRDYKPLGTVNVQLVRSASRWSHGIATEVSQTDGLILAADMCNSSTHS
jgi:phospholipase D1/2